MIIQTSTGQIYDAKENAATPHAYIGVELNQRTMRPKAKARVVLIRKAETRILSA
jgi:hypothetical protein